jgi:hypothetical protein
VREELTLILTCFVFSQILKRDKIIIEQYDPLQLPVSQPKDDEKNKREDNDDDDVKSQEPPSIELTPLRQFELKEISTSQIGGDSTTHVSYLSALSSLNREQHDTTSAQTLPLPSGTIDKVYIYLFLSSPSPPPLFFETVIRKIRNQLFL